MDYFIDNYRSFLVIIFKFKLVYLIVDIFNNIVNNRLK